MNPNEYRLKLSAELECLIDGHGAHHAASTAQTGALEVRLVASDGYGVVQMNLNADLVKAAEDVATSETYWRNEI